MGEVVEVETKGLGLWFKVQGIRVMKPSRPQTAFKKNLEA